MRRKHGIIMPDARNNLPVRVVNVKSKKRKKNNKIRLDKLLRNKRPIICIQRRLGGIGDVLMTTPLLRKIKELIPHCHLIYCTDLEYSQGALGDIIRHNPYVDQLISNEEFNNQKYDYTVDITATGLNKEQPGRIPPNRIDLFAEEVGVSVEDDGVPSYVVTEDERKQAVKRIEDEFLGGAKREDTNIIVVQARSNDARRTWPLNKVDKFCDLLAEDPKNRVIILDWGTSSKRWKSKERIFPVLNEEFIPVASLIEQCDLVVCPDSSALHIAGALGKKTITIFGPIPPQSRINYYTNATAVVLDLSCQFCWYNPVCLRSNVNRLDCLIGISPEMVLEAVNKKLQEPLKVSAVIKYGRDMTTVGSQDPIVLIKRHTDGIGDLVMATTAIETIKQKHPNKKLHVAVCKKLHSVLLNNKHIDEVIDVAAPINQKRYYLVYDISSPCARYESIRYNSNKKIEKSRVELFAEALGVRSLISDIKPRFYLTDDERKNGIDFLNANNIDKDKKTIAVAVHSAELYRDWPVENYKALISELSKNYNVVILNENKVNIYKNTIDACGLSFRKAVSVLSACDGLLTPDSGFMHIAEAIGIKTIALFGPVGYKARCKGYKNVTVVTSNLDCIPCWRNNNTVCKKKNLIKCHSKCMELIPAKHVVKIIKQKI